MKLPLTARKCLTVTSLVWLMCIFPLISLGEAATSKKPGQAPIESLDPAFAAALKSMYDRQPQMGTDGATHVPDGITKISPEEGMWLYELCRKIKPQRTLEIGMAYGFSTLYFLAAIKANGMGLHVAIDPFETTDWYGIGLKKVQDLGMEGSFRFIPEKDIFALPALAKEGLQFEVIFIDAMHRFDDVLVDFTLADQVCAPNGVIILSDMWMPSIRKAVSFIEKNRADYKRLDSPVANIRVFQKIGVDQRKWDHFVPF